MDRITRYPYPVDMFTYYDRISDIIFDRFTYWKESVFLVFSEFSVKFLGVYIKGLSLIMEFFPKDSQVHFLVCGHAGSRILDGQSIFKY